jgi:hypothetical protein
MFTSLKSTDSEHIGLLDTRVEISLSTDSKDFYNNDTEVMIVNMFTSLEYRQWDEHIFFTLADKGVPTG